MVEFTEIPAPCSRHRFAEWVMRWILNKKWSKSSFETDFLWITMGSEFQKKTSSTVRNFWCSCRVSCDHVPQPLKFWITFIQKIWPARVADPRFPRGGGANLQGGGANLLFGQKFPENCMNMKEFGPRWGVRPWHPLISANEHKSSNQNFFFLGKLAKYGNGVFHGSLTPPLPFGRGGGGVLGPCLQVYL